ncbi:MAG TPA: hypothetical protein VF546_19825 [Pyrinomonadaceae bacterium]|jgi:hypothetical protein
MSSRTQSSPFARRRRQLQLACCLCALLLLCCAPRARAQGQPPASPRQITDAQASLYERWRVNIRANQRAAYEAGKEYLAQYPEDEYAAYVRPWVTAYERLARKVSFAHLLYGEKNYGAAYKVGQEVLRDEPENPKALVELASAAYLATGAGDEAVRAAALALARRALERLDADPPAADWRPYAGPADAAGYLNFVVGDLILKDAPAEAISYLRRAARAESAVGRTPTLYARLAAAYAKSEYEPLARDFTARFAGKEATPESQAALARIYPALDRLIDAYARAVALSQNDPQYNATRARWQQELTELYKSRHDGSTDGLNELLGNVVNRPLPEPATP